MCWNPFPYWKSRSAKPRNFGGSLKAFQLEELLMLSAAPVPVDVIDPSLSADGGVVDVATVSAATSGEGTESSQQVTDVPQNESSASSDSVEDLLQQFGLNDTSDESQQNLELVFIDEATDNYQQLVDDLLDQGVDQTRIEIILLDSEEDGILQISEALEDYVNVDAVHIVSHGTEQSVKLGSTWLSLDNLDRFSESIAGWSDSFTPETDLLFYGCQLAENDSGQELLRQIQELTGADIAASTDDTGAANLGGDWDLEFELGELDTEVIFSSLLQNEWQGLLATETVLDQFNSQSYGNNDGTQNWNSNWVENDNSGGSQSASNGDVRITGGELRMVGDSGADNSVTREVDLSTAHDATLSFDATSSGTEAGDTFSLQISDDGGGSWTVLDVLEDYSGSYSRDISAYLAADTQIRIQIDSGYDGGLLGILFVEYLYIDNVQVSYTVNNPPDITSDGGGAAAVANVAENTTTVTTVTATDANLDTLNYAITGGADSGKFTINNSTGDLTFITAPDYESPTDNNSDNIYEVIVEASDGFGGTDSQTILVTVTPVNETPTAADNTVTTNEDTPYIFTAADFNFSDIDGDTLASVKITALETVGALQLSGADVTLNQVISRADIDAGNLTFTPVTNASGSSYDSFGFVVNDGALESSPSNTMTVDVTAVNDAPTASDNTVTTSEDTPYTFTAADFNYSDVEGDSLASVKITALEIVGALQLSGADVTLNQVISRADIDAGNLTFTPVANASGTSYDSFGFVVNDGALESSPSNTMTVDVTAVNDAPTAADNTVTTSEDTPYTFTAADFNFSDIEGDSLASVQITSIETVGSLQLSGLDVTLNQVVSRADIDAGNLTFTPAANASGSGYASFGFSVNDGTVDSVSSYVMTVDVTAVNDAPTAADNTVTTGEDTTYVFVAADFNFSDLDGDTLASVQITSLETVGSLQLSGVDVTLNQVVSRADIDAGNLTFTPASNANGSSYDSFGFTVNDGMVDSVSAYTMTVDVNGTNDAPTASDNTVTTSEDTPYVFSAADFNFSDIDGDALVSVQVTSLESVGALQLSGVDITLNQVISRVDIDAGNLTFMPATNANGTSYDSFGFRVNDGITNSVASYSMTVDVTAVNDVPTAGDNTVTTSEDTTYTFSAADFNFSDIDGDALASIQITSLETVGSLQLSGVDVTLNQVVSRADIDAGNLTFTPVANASGSSYDSFGFTVNDGTVDSSSVSTMTVDVTPVNDAPTAADNTVIMDEDTTYSFAAADFNFSDIDADTLASIQITSLEAVGSLQLSGVDVSLNQVVSRADLDAGNLTFTPAANASGTSYDSFGFTVNDGAADSVTSYTMTMDVTSLNDAPTAADNTVTTGEDTTYAFTAADFNFSDLDGDTLANIQITSLETVGALQLSGVDVTLNQVVSRADLDAGNLTFTPVVNASGTSYDSFGFSVNDGTVDSSSAYTMTVDVTPANDAPTAADNTVSTVENTTYTFTAADFGFSDIDGDMLASIQITSLESVGSLQLSGVDVTLNQIISKVDLDAGNLTFTPVADTSGVAYDSFGFTVNDGTVDSIAAYAMTIDITPDPGNMILDQFNTQAYNNNDGTVNWSNDWVENDSSGGSQSPTNGDVRITGGELRIVGESGAYNSVTREADLSTAHDATLSFSAVSSGTESNDSFSVQISDDGGGSWTVLDVLTDFTGNYSRDISAWTAADTQVRIQIDTGYDGGLLGLLFVEYLYVDDVQISYTVNNAPVITSDGGGSAAVINVAENTTAMTTVAASDPDLDPVGYTITGGTDAGLFTIDNTTGELAFINPPDYESPLDSNADNVYEVTVSASDSYGGSDSQTMLISVTPVNEPPTAVNSMVTASEDTTYTFTTADFNFSDLDGDSLASVTITSLESVGALQLFGVDVSLNQVISRADLDAGNLTFTPVVNANGTSYDSFGFSVNDGTLESTATYTMTVDVSPVNDAPTAADNLVTTSEDTPYLFSAADFNFSDLDGDPLASVRITSLETVGVLQLSGLDVTLNQVISRTDIDAGNLTFNPVANASGTSYDSFGFSVSEGALESTPPNIMTINVTAVNDPPTASDSTVITDEDTSYTFTAADFNFSDVDGDPLDSVRISSLPAVGMLQLSGVDVTQNQVISRTEIDAGNLTYVPLADGNGVAYDSFGFVVSDGSLEATGASTMTVDVVPVNDAPVITSNGGGLNATVHVSGVLSTVATIEATDAESDVQVLTFSISGGLDADQFSIDASSGQLSFAAATELGGNSNDVYEVSVQVSDGVGGTATQLLTVIVDQSNQSFPSDQQTSDDTDSTSDSDQSDQNDSSSDSEGADHNSGTGNEDLIFSSLPADSDLFSQSQSRNTQANGVVLFASATPVDFSSLSQPLLDFTLETATDNVVTDYAYEAGGGQSTRTAVLRASIDPLRNSLEIHASEVVYTQLVWTRYDEIQEQVNLTAESDQLYISTAAVITTTVTSGLLIWALQGGYLMVGLASGLPTWRFMDPIAVLDEFGEDSDDEGDSLQSLIEQAETRTENQSATSDESEVV
ncbi:Cadherin domain protein [Gimesia panareensis]|uniref:Cadherin domain protein n=1 Tax=Gimesia panareensis TaxID=2527978 RepID=A0A518FT96_9PLAN|nr:Ig-like domain-containing protein [Gimesia panareensis]QDV19553.1 Cadherin domain protein [Gimesia panareensis]